VRSRSRSISVVAGGGKGKGKVEEEGEEEEEIEDEVLEYSDDEVRLSPLLHSIQRKLTRRRGDSSG
jgi:hypothetical protein